MARLIILVTVLSRSALLSPAYASKWPEKAQFDYIKGNTIYFKAEDDSKPLPLETNLYDLEYISTLFPSEQGKLPYVVISARSCADCPREKEIHVIRADGGKVSTFLFPGTIKDRKTGATLLEARAFYGKCLKDKPADVYVVFQREKIDRRGGLRHSVYVAEAADRQLNEKLLISRLPPFSHTLQKVKKNECFEIKGFARSKSNEANIYELFKKSLQGDPDNG